MPRGCKSVFKIAAFLLFLSLVVSCYERYPFFIQIPEFIESSAGADRPGILLSIVCEDEHALIRYTIDGSLPGEDHGLIYAEPLYLGAQDVHIQAVALRIGYPAGPVGEYLYESP